MAKIIDDTYETIENDIEKVQRKPTMYISFTGSEGTGHLAKEMTNNMIDEDENENSISDGKMYIFHDAVEGMTYFSDNGRGIPFEELESACTILHSGTKMDRKHGNTAGENGVGLTVTNALSETFEITSTREGKSRMLRFHEGKKILDRTIDVKDKKKHGLLVGFKPSKYFLGPDSNLNVEELDIWLTKLSFSMNPRIEITFSCEGLPGKTSIFKRVYKNTKGIAGYLEHFEPDSNLLPKPIVLHNEMQIVEENVPVREDNGAIKLDSMDREISLDVAFNFNPKSQEPVFHAYCNDIENIQGGEHQNAVKNTISGFFTKLATEALKKNEKIEYVQNDALAGLTVVLYLNTTMSTKFESQTKHKLGNKLFYQPVRKLCLDSLTEYFKYPENKKTLNKILDYVKFNAKLRMDITNKRKTVKTSSSSFLESKCIVGLTPPNLIGSNKSNMPLELYIVEGDSAGGLVRKARKDPDIQGVLCLRGKVPNVYSKTSSWLQASNDMFKFFFDDILGCGFGKHFNIENLKYDKIIIGSDTDVDGDHIAGLILAAIYKHAPALITEGHVYRAVVPLYKLMDKKANANSKKVNPEQFLYQKYELFERQEKEISKHIGLKFEPDGDFVSSANLRRFLSTNRDYFQLLDDISRHYSLHPDIVEFIAEHPKDFKKRIKELGPEMEYSEEDDCITGIYEGEHRNIIPDEIFMKKISYLTKVIQVGNEGISHYHIFEKKNKNSESVYIGYLSIGQIMALCQKYSPDIQSRYKGWGELNAYEMQELAMNPKARILLRFHIGDVEKTVETLDSLFLSKNRKIRKQLIQDADVSLDDIDN